MKGAEEFFLPFFDVLVSSNQTEFAANFTSLCKHILSNINKHLCQGASEPPRTTQLLFYVSKLQQTSPDENRFLKCGQPKPLQTSVAVT